MKLLFPLLLSFIWMMPLPAQSGSLAVETVLSDTQQKIINLLIPIDEDTQTAVFQRNGYVYVVLNQKTVGNIAALDSPVLQKARKIESSSGIVLQFLLSPQYHWFVNRRSRYLILSLSTVPQKDDVIPIVPQKSDNAVSFNIEPTNPIVFTDPVTGEELTVFPVFLHEQKVERRYATQTFEIPQTDQGLLLIENIPHITHHYDNHRLTLTSPSDLLLNTDIAFAISSHNDILDFSDIAQMTREDFYKERNRLQDLISAMPKNRRAPFKKALARLYLSQGLDKEAVSLINGIPQPEQDDEIRTIKTVALLTQGLTDEADETFHNITHPNEHLTAVRQFIIAPETLSETDFYTLMNGLSPRLFLSVSFQSLPSLWQAEQIQRLSYLLNKISPYDLSPYRRQSFLLYTGLVMRHNGQIAQARTSFQKAADIPVISASNANSRYQLILIDLEQGNIDAEEAIKKLENLRYVYREPSFEAMILETLNTLYRRQKDYANALRTYRSLFLIRHDTADTREMSNLFQEAILENPNMPPFDKLALFYEFVELIPADDTGNEIMMRLTDTFIDLDLLKQAYDVSYALARHRFIGSSRQDFYFKAALIALLNQNDKDARVAFNHLDEGTAYRRIIQTVLDNGQAEKCTFLKENVDFLHPVLVNYLQERGWLQ